MTDRLRLRAGRAWRDRAGAEARLRGGPPRAKRGAGRSGGRRSAR